MTFLFPPPKGPVLFPSLRVIPTQQNSEHPLVRRSTSGASRKTRCSSVPCILHDDPQQRVSPVLPGKRLPSSARPPKRRGRASKKFDSTLELVREGVRRFILSDASIGDFHTAIHVALKTGEMSPHPLTRAALRNIIKQAILEKQWQENRSSGRKRTIRRKALGA